MQPPLRPDGTPLHPEDGWDETRPITFHLCPHVKSFEWDRKVTAPFQRIALSKHAETEDKHSVYLWSFVLTNAMARKESSVTHVTALVFDFDKGKTPWEDVADLLQSFGVAFWTHQSHSHRDDCHAFRLVLPISEAIPVDEYREAYRAVAWWFKWELWDKSCADPCRLWYLPSYPPGGTAWVDWNIGGSLVDWRGILAAHQEHKAKHAKPAPQPAMELPAGVKRRSSFADLPDAVRLERELAIREKAADILLSAKHPDDGHEVWRRTCLALFDAFGDSQRAHDWSRRSEKYDAREVEHLYRWWCSQAGIPAC